MSGWLIATPLIAWLTAGLTGIALLRVRASRLWEGVQLRPEKIPYDASFSQRWFVGFVRIVGGLMLFMPIFLTLMSLLVALGVVAPAKS